jgi:hypothetical protein
MHNRCGGKLQLGHHNDMSITGVEAAEAQVSGMKARRRLAPSPALRTAPPSRARQPPSLRADAPPASSSDHQRPLLPVHARRRCTRMLISSSTQGSRGFDCQRREREQNTGFDCVSKVSLGFICAFS